MTTTDRTGPRLPAGTLAALRAERDFLLRSLDDLDAEHAAGELTDRRWVELRDQYTVQAATVLRAIDRLEPASPAPAADTPVPRRRRRRLAGAALVAVALAVGAGLLANALGDRRPGQTITGNSELGASDLDRLARAARQRPEHYETQIAYAIALMEAGEAVDALRAFDTAAQLDPDAAAPKAYGGWLVFLAGLTDEALGRIDAAIAADPDYPDAHFFRGMVLLRGRDDRTAAVDEFRRFLDLAPPGPERDQVEQLLAQLTDNSTATSMP